MSRKEKIAKVTITIIQRVRPEKVITNEYMLGKDNKLEQMNKRTMT